MKRKSNIQIMRIIKQQISLLLSASHWRFSNKSWRIISFGQYLQAIGSEGLQCLLSPYDSMISQLAFSNKVIHLSNMYAFILGHGACTSQMTDIGVTAGVTSYKIAGLHHDNFIYYQCACNVSTMYKKGRGCNLSLYPSSYSF